MKTITKDGTLYDENGYRKQEHVHVLDDGDTVCIGSAVHNKSDIVIAETSIAAPNGAWEVKW